MAAQPDFASGISVTVNGVPRTSSASPLTRLSDVLRDDFGLTGTKVGCEAGDCGACTVLLDGEQVCACLVPLAQAEGRSVATVEGLAGDDGLAQLQQAFARRQAAQCGICTPGMLMAATDLLGRTAQPATLTARQVQDALGGVLCRCTGYAAIVDAVLDVACGAPAASSDTCRGGVGDGLARIDARSKLDGAARFGADAAPAGALWLRVIRSPHPRATFELGDLEAFRARHPALVAVLSAADVPGVNGFGIYPHIKDQPVLASGEVRFAGEPVLALVGPRDAVEAIAADALPVEYAPLPPVTGVDAALAQDAPEVQTRFEGNVLTRGRLFTGDAEAAFASAPHVAEVQVRTGFVEHAYIEPEAGYALRVGDRIEVFATTQSPYMDRDEVANVLGIAPTDVRIIPSTCGGGFGGKLDQSVQPLLALAAWQTGQPVRCAWTRPESMRSSTKRHPAHISARAACDASGRLTAMHFRGDFDTGAYASWGPTVADRVPVHCSGPYVVPKVDAGSCAVLTNAAPSGAFRGFGVPQAALAHEALMDALADQCGLDRLEFRHRNAIRAGDRTASGHRLDASAGLAECLDALRERWRQWREEALAASDSHVRRGVGIGCMWYGCGNTSMSNPSDMRIDLQADGRLILYSGAVDIGQGVTTILVQIAAEALGVPSSAFEVVTGDTDLTADAGKSSASRQTFVSGKAVQLAADELRAQLAQRANASPDAAIEIDGSSVRVSDAGETRALDLAGLPPLDGSTVMRGHGTLRSAEHRRSTKTGRASPTARTDSARRLPRSRSTSSSARCKRSAHRRRARRRPCHQPPAGARAGGRRHRPGARSCADGGVPARPNRQSARLPDPDLRRHARHRGDPDRGPGAARPVRRQGGRRARPHPDRGGDLRRHRACHRRASGPRTGDAGPAAGTPAGRAGRSRRRGRTMTDETVTVPRIRCDACPLLCNIRPGKTGACDRYANVEAGRLVRLDPVLIMRPRCDAAWSRPAATGTATR